MKEENFKSGGFVTNVKPFKSAVDLKILKPQVFESVFTQKDLDRIKNFPPYYKPESLSCNVITDLDRTALELKRWFDRVRGTSCECH